MFHIYVVSVLSGYYIYLQWIFSRVSKCFASVSNTYCNCFSCFVRILQVFYLNASKVDRDVAMWPTLPKPSVATAWASCMRVGSKGIERCSTATQEVEGDGGRGIGVPCASCGCGKWRAGASGKWMGRRRSDRGTKWGAQFPRSNSVRHWNGL
jgi:hypothetical protein